MQRSILLCLSESFYFHNMIIGILFDFVNNLFCLLRTRPNTEIATRLT